MSVTTVVPLPTSAVDGEGAKDIFSVYHQLEIPAGDEIDLFAKHSEGDVNFFAVTIKR